jgi:hypothetical protein
LRQDGMNNASLSHLNTSVNLINGQMFQFGTSNALHMVTELVHGIEVCLKEGEIGPTDLNDDEGELTI